MKEKDRVDSPREIKRNAPAPARGYVRGESATNEDNKRAPSGSVPLPAKSPWFPFALVVVLTFLIALAGMTAYELLKTILMPRVTMWESHTITICVGALLAVGMVCLAERRHRVLLRVLADREEILQESGRRHRILFECSRDALMTLEPPLWGFSSGNQAAVDMFGARNVEEFISYGPGDLSPQRQGDGRASAGKAKEMIETALREGSHFFEWAHKRVDGGEFPATVLLSRLDTGDRQTLQATVRDVTEQKRAEEKSQETLHRQQGISLLQQSLLAPAPLEDKLKAVTDGIVQIFDADFCRVWLIRRGDLCERDCMHAEVHEGPHVCRHRDKCLHLLASSGRYTHTDGKGHRRVPFGCYKIGRVASDQEHRFLTNDVTHDPRVHNRQWAKELGLASFAGYQLRVPGGQTMGVLALFAKHPIGPEEDAMLDSLGSAVALVVQEAAAQDAVHAAKAEAERANAAKSHFLANMSHEIRTPMTAILGFAELVGNSIECCVACPEYDACAIRAQNKEHIGIIRRNGEHLLGLINDVLDLSKIEAGRMEVERVACSPVQLVEEVVSLMRVRAIAKGLTLEARYEFPLPATIRSDPTRLRQVLTNLVGNAVKFTPSGQVEIAVRWAADPRRGEATMAFAVRDTGIGVTPEQIGRLFQPFAQADSSTSRQHGGTGLGLSISSRLAEAMGGGIAVESRPGEGSTFTFTLKTALDGEAGMLSDLAGAARPSRLESTCSVDLKLHGTVLVAEDGLDNQKLISAILSQAGAEADLAPNGVQAVAKALSARSAGKPYDVILMDMQMPEMDGYEATRRLRQAGYTGPIVALTAHAMAEERPKCLAAGCDEYATKPVDRPGLLRLLGRLMPSSMGEPPEEPASPAEAPLQAAIRSRFAADPEMAGLIEGFVGRLPGVLAAMSMALANNAHDELKRLAHQLKGAGGGYGYPTLTEQASRLEDAAKAGDVEAARLMLNAMTHLCERIAAGHAPVAVPQEMGNA